MEFIEETEEAIRESGHTIADIEFIGDKTRQVSLGNWKKFSYDIQQAFQDEEVKERNCGYKVCEDLIIAFSDSSLLYRTGTFAYEKWEFLPSHQSCKRPAQFLNAKHIVKPQGGVTTTLKVMVNTQVAEYRKQVREELGI